MLPQVLSGCTRSTPAALFVHCRRAQARCYRSYGAGPVNKRGAGAMFVIHRCPRYHGFIAGTDCKLRGEECGGA